MTISLPGVPAIVVSGEVSVGVDRAALPTVREMTATREATPAAGDFVVDWQLAVATGAQW